MVHGEGVSEAKFVLIALTMGDGDGSGGDCKLALAAGLLTLSSAATLQPASKRTAASAAGIVDTWCGLSIGAVGSTSRDGTQLDHVSHPIPSLSRSSFGA
jgi:hypothetical protein